MKDTEKKETTANTEKDRIFSERKELKKKAKLVVRRHYFLLLFLSAVMMFFGVEYNLTIDGMEDRSIYDVFLGEEETEVKEEKKADTILDSGDVLGLILVGDMQSAIFQSDKLLQSIKESPEGSAALGRTDGVLAGMVNAVSSGKLFVTIGQGLQSIFHSNKATAIIFILGSLLFFMLVHSFRTLYSAIYRRMYLEARVYEKVSLMDILHFLTVRKMWKALWTMFVSDIYLSLWSLTIIGGIIKTYSYACVPDIVAENPSLKANEAITLSRRMMNGHKIEFFKYQMTMLGWIILGIVTLGISDLVYGVPYRSACYAEFYARLRTISMDNGLTGTEALDDRYLFERADKILLYETYFPVVDEITLLHEEKPEELTGFRKVMSDWLGIWVGSLESKRKHENYEGRSFAIAALKDSMEGKTYPQWLNPRWRKKEIEKQDHFSFLRCYSVWTLILLFLGFSFVGWVWEVSLHLIQTGEFANRGTLFGPWLPIYGSGGVIVLLLCSHFRKNPVAEFILATLLCGTLEYFSGWYLETRYHQRWWSYDGYFLNIHGRVCAEGLLVFGVGCCAIVYLLAPAFDYLISKIKARTLVPLCIVLLAVFTTDLIYSSAHPNASEGAVESASLRDLQGGEDVGLPGGVRIKGDPHLISIQQIPGGGDAVGQEGYAHGVCRL